MNIKINKNYIILFLLGVIILFVRSGYNFITPIIYAEDGTWMSDIINNGFLYTLLNAKGAYFVFGNIILLEFSRFLNFIFCGYNLTYLPIFISLVQYIFMISCSLIAVKCMEKELNKYLRFLLWILILLVPLGYTGFEVLGKILNVGFLFYFIATCLLFYRIFRRDKLSKYNNIILDFILFICCGTNPGCYVLVGIGFFLDIFMQYGIYRKSSLLEMVKAYWSSFSNRLWLILGISCSFMLFYNIMNFKISFNGVIGSVNIRNTIEFFTRSLLFYFVYPIYTFLNDKIALVLFLLCFIIIIIVYKNANKLEKIKVSFLLFCAIFYAIITFLNRMTLTGHLNNYTTSWVDRYYYGINITTLLPIFYVVSLLLKKSKITKLIAYISLIILIICPLIDLTYLFQYDDAQTLSAHKIKWSDKILSIPLDTSMKRYIISIESSRMDYEFTI